MIAKEYELVAHAAIQSRGFFLPPNVAQALESTIQDIVIADQADTVIEKFEPLYLAHPEPSLALFIASQFMSKNDFAPALKWAERALQAQGFIDDTKIVALESAYITSLLLARKTPESEALHLTYCQNIIDLAKDFEDHDYLINKYSKESNGTALIIGLTLALEHFQHEAELAERWLDRIEAADSPPEERILWVRLVIALRTENWTRVVKLSDQLLALPGKRSVDYDAVKSAKSRAESEIEKEPRKS